MERVPYRRYREAGNYIESETDENAGALGETLILQGIISGLLLVVVMLISMVTLGFMQPVQEVLAQTLSGAETPTELWQYVRAFGADTLGLQWLE